VSAPAWEAYLAERFPGYLLPEAYRRALPEEAAARFLERLSGRADQLFVLRASSVVAREADAIQTFALDELPRLAKSLPPRSEIEQRVWEGKAPGRLDVPATLQRRRQGRISELVTRVRQRHVGSPENVLAKVAARRLASVLAALRSAGATSSSGWGAALPECEEALGRVLGSAAFAGVTEAPITALHEQAAGASRDRAHVLAAGLHRALREGLDATDPEEIARAVSAGALAPLADHTRFEIAVVVRLLEAIEGRLQTDRWTLTHALVMKGRREVASFERADGASVAVFYNQATLAPGRYARAVERYFGQRGRLRPDVTVRVAVPGRAPRAAVVEAKLSEDLGYLVDGYQEAMLYAAEYAAELDGWPRAILVASSALPGGAPSREDEVVAVDWARWVPDEVLDGLLEGLS
jgi:hypothetical protein